ncbi:MAG: RsmE family RNA methyltransferase [Saprospiraceae bacterium]
MHTFYADIIGEEVCLIGEEHKHCSTVMRSKVGDTIIVFDGKGSKAECEIIKISKSETICSLIQKVRLSDIPAPSLGICPTKNNARLEWCIEKATEIGTKEIIIFKSERSEKMFTKLDRLHKIVISAAKQSGNLFLPKITVLNDLKTLIGVTDHYTSKFIAHCHQAPISITDTPIHSDAIILIGPEGDFTEDEILLCEKNNYKSVHLGASRLRTETAAIVALTLMQFSVNKV